MREKKALSHLKAFQVGEDGLPRFIFHGVNGSRVVPMDRWIKAKQKLVRNGSGQMYYKSGFHSFQSMADTARWQKSVRKDYAICRVWVRGVRRKWSGRCFLSQYMFLSSKDFKQAL